MPLYTIMCARDLFDDAGRERLAVGITDLHSRMAGVPPEWVHVIFQEFPPNHGFTAGRRADVVAMTLVIRDGRPSEYKRLMITALWHLLQEATGAADDQIVIGIQEVPPSQAMEMGQIMPDVAGA